MGWSASVWLLVLVGWLSGVGRLLGLGSVV